MQAFISVLLHFCSLLCLFVSNETQLRTSQYHGQYETGNSRVHQVAVLPSRGTWAGRNLKTSERGNAALCIWGGMDLDHLMVCLKTF